MLNNKKIVVTGAASGIGAETAKVIKAQGGTVIGVDRNETTANVDEFIQVDLTDKAAIDAAVAKINGFDGLANIAGLPPTLPAKMVLTVNWVALKYLTESLVGKMNQGGSIVNVASLAGAGWPNAVDSVKDAIANMTFDNIEDFISRYEVDDARSYFYSKEILVVWTMLNRWTWRDNGIRMNSVSPGPVDTPILKDFLATLGERAEEDMKVMDRAGLPTDIAPVIAFLLSDGSGWIRGTNVPTDGGMFSHIQENMFGLK